MMPFENSTYEWAPWFSVGAAASAHLLVQSLSSACPYNCLSRCALGKKTGCRMKGEGVYFLEMDPFRTSLLFIFIWSVRAVALVDQATLT